MDPLTFIEGDYYLSSKGSRIYCRNGLEVRCCTSIGIEYTIKWNSWEFFIDTFSPLPEKKALMLLNLWGHEFNVEELPST